MNKILFSMLLISVMLLSGCSVFKPAPAPTQVPAALQTASPAAAPTDEPAATLTLEPTSAATAKGVESMITEAATAAPVPQAATPSAEDQAFLRRSLKTAWTDCSKGCRRYAWMPLPSVANTPWPSRITTPSARLI